MAEKDDFLSRINEHFSHLSKGQKLIASYVIDHYDLAVFMTAAEIAEAVGVSESTVVRFAVSVGYEGFPEFTRALEKWYKTKMNTVSMVGKKYGKASQSDLLNTVLRSDMEKMEDTIANLDVEAFELAVDIILKAKKVYVVGLRTCEPLAEFLSFYLNMIRPDVVLLKTTSASEMFEQMIRIDEKDCIIGISFPRYSMRTLKAMEFANDRNAKVITLTDSVHSPMNLYSSCNLLARSDMVSIVDSLVAPLSVINALVVALCLKRPKEVKENLENLETVWGNYQIYLNDEINFIDDEPILNYSLNKEEED
ncbi:transcriptional regulator, RpiR family [Lachnospiraceae bacterium YSD2013]|nr:MurR/RpiR family transcriptional regulator [Lachnospiraceae bacterium]MBR5762724.1 MurR/RpiR family transcriptional regulator [Lachnospiraceae bacterium]MCR4679326.1 MurR/RpiR family transcriptional regulator [Lachnospiraceae bacterium]SCW99734.1 transcriptional regulator, RpiR family [Lachnospiraceae bacterium YSD2013]